MLETQDTLTFNQLSNKKLIAAAKDLPLSQTILETLFDSEGNLLFQPELDLFDLSVRLMCTQGNSLKAGQRIVRRLRSYLSVKGPLKPSDLDFLSFDDYRALGMTPMRVRNLQALLAEWERTDFFQTKRFQSMSQAEISDQLMSFPHIGPWFVEMFLLFGLGRVDVLLSSDKNVKAEFSLLFDQKIPVSPSLFLKMAAPYKPWRSLLSLFLWKKAHHNNEEALSCQGFPV